MTTGYSFNKFFDLLNVRSLTEVIRERNPNKEPYRSPDDGRLEVMILLRFLE